MEDFLSVKPVVIAALHLPPFKRGSMVDRSYLEDYLLTNLRVFAEGGIPAVKIQDQTPVSDRANPETIAWMASLGRLAKQEFPQVALGSIIEAHDPYAAIAIAHACGFSFVRIKVFVGAMLKSTGIQQACGVESVTYRDLIGASQVKILADVHDRTGFPLVDMPIEQGERWAVNTGADALVLTGSSFADSIEILKRARKQNLKRPLILGGSATSENIGQVLEVADGVIVSSALKRKSNPGDLLQWDISLVKQIMDAVGKALA
jgi:membrane complex biogenesis BtpA family protein